MTQRGGVTDEKFILAYLTAKYDSEIHNERRLIECVPDDMIPNQKKFSIVYLFPISDNSGTVLPDIFGADLHRQLKDIFPHPMTTITRDEPSLPTKRIGVACMHIRGNPTVMKECIRTKDPALFDEIEEKLSRKSRE